MHICFSFVSSAEICCCYQSFLQAQQRRPQCNSSHYVHDSSADSQKRPGGCARTHTPTYTFIVKHLHYSRSNFLFLSLNVGINHVFWIGNDPFHSRFLKNVSSWTRRGWTVYIRVSAAGLSSTPKRAFHKVHCRSHLLCYWCLLPSKKFGNCCSHYRRKTE